jgi:hypothetical protein
MEVMARNAADPSNPTWLGGGSPEHINTFGWAPRVRPSSLACLQRLVGVVDININRPGLRLLGKRIDLSDGG